MSEADSDEDEIFIPSAHAAKHGTSSVPRDEKGRQRLQQCAWICRPRSNALPPGATSYGLK